MLLEFKDDVLSADIAVSNDGALLLDMVLGISSDDIDVDATYSAKIVWSLDLSSNTWGIKSMDRGLISINLFGEARLVVDGNSLDYEDICATLKSQDNVESINGSDSEYILYFDIDMSCEGNYCQVNRIHDFTVEFDDFNSIPTIRISDVNIDVDTKVIRINT